MTLTGKGAGWVARRLLTGLLVLAPIVGGAALAAESAPIALNQGKNWTAETQADFYSRDQGSRIMPLSWISALKQADGSPFMANSLSRYGYLPNEHSIPAGLPVGFTVASASGGEMIGMTCSACHTRQIAVKDKTYRIDGGPAIVDFQRFLTDLDLAVGKLLSDPAAFTDFSHALLGQSASADKVAALHKEVEDWYLPYHTIVELALPLPGWGPGRLDAVSMIFNRLTGLDIGPPPSYIIRDNIKPANAPVRYPFLWNASLQDKTQWPGFADNGDSVVGLARNIGEVIGVFAVFHPKQDDGRLLGVNYVGDNSVNFRGLEDLEKMIRKIGPPKWPWAVNASLAAQGRLIYAQTCAKSCHEISKGAFRSLRRESWATPVQDVGTDTREWSILQRNVDPGSLTGAEIPALHPPLKNPDAPINVLGLSVIGSILQHALPVVVPADLRDKIARSGSAFGPETQSLKGAFRPVSAAPQTGSYEARVLQGIWAAAPYLHNGSVPTLAELLKPAAERVAAFKIGPAYDPVNIGLAVDQPGVQQILQTTDCGDRDSGNSRCGHEFGTRLSASQKKALLEYLKTL